MIYIDCDDVLANFSKFCIELTGKTYQTYISGEVGTNSWDKLEKVDNLFYQLEVIQGAKESIASILDQQGYHNVEVLTALPLLTCKLKTAQRDKVTWVKDYIDSMLQVNCVANWSHKKYFCRNSWDILIDDHHRNIEEWVAAGGVGILHSKWEETNKELKRIGVI